MTDGVNKTVEARVEQLEGQVAFLADALSDLTRLMSALTEAQAPMTPEDAHREFYERRMARR